MPRPAPNSIAPGEALHDRADLAVAVTLRG
jgi:hypothetical protein